MEPARSMMFRTRLSAHFFFIPLCFRDALSFVNIVQFAGEKTGRARLHLRRGLPRVKVLLTRAILCDSYTLKILTA